MSSFYASCSLCGTSMGMWMMSLETEDDYRFVRSIQCDTCKQNKVLAKMIADELVARGLTVDVPTKDKS